MSAFPRDDMRSIRALHPVGEWYGFRVGQLPFNLSKEYPVVQRIRAYEENGEMAPVAWVEVYLEGEEPPRFRSKAAAWIIEYEPPETETP